MTKDLEQNQANFESIRHVEAGAEYWSARELMPLLEYSKWENFNKVLDKAKVACRESDQNVGDHFPDVRKAITGGKGATQEVDDIKLTRYACYLIAQNGDPRKKAIALAQSYFAMQTRRQEVAQLEMADRKRLAARERLSETERKFSGVLHSRGVDSKGIAEIRSAGDEQLFGGHSTKEMKARYDVKESRPLADFMPTVLLKAKDLATEMTTVNTIEKKLKGKPVIKTEHEQNNRSVRGALLDRDIEPEALPPAEDLKKVERRLKKQKALDESA